MGKVEFRKVLSLFKEMQAESTLRLKLQLTAL